MGLFNQALCWKRFSNLSAQKKRVVTISDSNRSFSSGKAAFFSQTEVLLEFLVFLQHEQCHISVQHHFRRDVYIGFAVPLHAEDIDAVFPSAQTPSSAAAVDQNARSG